MKNMENNNQNYNPENNARPAQSYEPQPVQAQPDQNFEPQPAQAQSAQNFEPQPAPNYTQQSNQVYEAQPFRPQTQVNQSNNEPKAIASLICGIVSIVCCCSVVLGLGSGVAAIITGVLSRKTKPENNTMANVGLILGIVGVVFSIAAIIFYVIGIINNSNHPQTIAYSTQDFPPYFN